MNNAVCYSTFVIAVGAFFFPSTLIANQARISIRAAIWSSLTKRSGRRPSHGEKTAKRRQVSSLIFSEWAREW